MRITPDTLFFLNAAGTRYVREAIIKGLKKELELNGGENGDFDAVCEMWEHLEKNPNLLPLVVKELNSSDVEDMFGTEGWEFRFGLDN
jgi:hypothetical protein